VSHDTDKLIRQLSLVAFLMAERRPITARDVKTNVEGYSEMSDEAFARRFYSDRAELIQLGVPLHSQRDEFTGEELYTLRSEQYFLPALELDDDELAALQTALHVLDGRFAYAEPLRLALQNLALGRGGPFESTREAALQVLDPEYSEEMSGRLTKLEGAISKGRTVKFAYERADGKKAERTVNPYALFSENGSWYFVGWDHDRKDVRTFRALRIQGDIRFATRRERDFRIPADFDAAEHRGRARWQYGDLVGEARVELAEDLAWQVERTFSERSTVEGSTFVTPYADLGPLASWILSQAGRARPLEPPELVELVETSVQQVVEAHHGDPPKLPRAAPRVARASAERSAGPVAPERFGLLQALLAYLLARCGEEPSVDIPAEELSERFHIPADQLDEHLQLLNLVNFGGGCYAVYASLEDSTVHVEKELWGDTFRRPPRLTPLEARAIRLALEFVGPMIAADAHTPLDRVRHKLEETFGQFERADGGLEAQAETEEERLVRTLSEAMHEHRLVEFEYMKPEETTASTRTVEPYKFRRQLPDWYVDVWDRDRDAVRSFRLDRMRDARKLDGSFEPRPGIAPNSFENSGTARVLYTKGTARRHVERGAARRLSGGAAVEDRVFGSVEYLAREILEARGEAIVVEPPEVRDELAARVREIAADLTAAPAGSKRR
jgi:proteasome accessory factor BC